MQQNDDPSRPAQLDSELKAKNLPAMTRRRFLIGAGGTILSGVAVTALNACFSESIASSAPTPGTASLTDATQTSTPGMTLPTPAPATTTLASTTMPVVVDGTLRIPPLLVPQVQNDTKVFNLTLQK